MPVVSPGPGARRDRGAAAPTPWEGRASGGLSARPPGSGAGPTWRQVPREGSEALAAETSARRRDTLAASEPIAWKWALTLPGDGTDTSGSRCDAAERATRSSQGTREPSRGGERGRCASGRPWSPSLGKASPGTPGSPDLPGTGGGGRQSPATTWAGGSGSPDDSSVGAPSPLPGGPRPSGSAS